MPRKPRIVVLGLPLGSEAFLENLQKRLGVVFSSLKRGKTGKKENAV